MKRVLFGVAIVISTLIFIFSGDSTLADEDIYGLRIENINRHGADFYWSTSVITVGSVEYAYAKLPQLYNPQSPGTQQDILISATPMQTRSEEHYVKSHHLRVDNLDLYYCPFVRYTVKSRTEEGDIYEISGEFVLVDTGRVNWWQTWQYAVFVPIATFILGRIAWPRIARKSWKPKKSI